MKRAHIKRSLLLGCAVLALCLGAAFEADLLAFTLTGSSWSGGAAGFRVNANFTDPSAGTAQQQIDALRAASDEWKFAGQSNFQFTYQGTTSVASVAPDGVNTVFYSNTDGNGALAVTFWWMSGSTTTDFDMQFFDRDGAMNFVWATSPAGSQFDIQGVATHEFGHALGLGHSSIGAATMFPSVSAGSTATRTLDPDDIAGIQTIYGVAPPPAPVPTAVSPDHGWVDGGTFVTITGTDFSPTGMSVSFGGQPSAIVNVSSATTLSCMVPGGVSQGAQDVTLSAGGLSGTLPGGYTRDTCRAPAGTNLVPGWNSLECKVPADSGKFYRGLLSTVLQNTPMTAFDPTDTRMFPLGWSDLLFFTFHADQFPSTYWSNTSGFLDAGGQAFFQVNAPNVPGLSGVQIYTSFYVLDAQAISGVSTVSNALTLVLP